MTTTHRQPESKRYTPMNLLIGTRTCCRSVARSERQSLSALHCRYAFVVGVLYLKGSDHHTTPHLLFTCSRRPQYRVHRTKKASQRYSRHLNGTKKICLRLPECICSGYTQGFTCSIWEDAEATASPKRRPHVSRLKSCRLTHDVYEDVPLRTTSRVCYQQSLCKAIRRMVCFYHARAGECRRRFFPIFVGRREKTNRIARTSWSKWCFPGANCVT